MLSLLLHGYWLQLDLWGVADENNHLFKLPTLVDMLDELLAPYGELRLNQPTPDEEDAFYLRHGETRDSLKVCCEREKLPMHPVAILREYESYRQLFHRQREYTTMVVQLGVCCVCKQRFVAELATHSMTIDD